MSIKILTKNGVENTNIDGARDCNFNAGNRSGIVKSVLNEGRLFSVSSNTIGLDTCELRIFGHRIVIDEIQYKTFTSIPSSPVRYALVAQISVTKTVPTFALNVQSVDTVLYTDNINNGNGIYEIELGRFTHNTDGSVTDIVRTIDIITGGISGGNSEYISIGAVTTNTLDPNLSAEVDVENRKTPEGKMVTDFSFSIPRGIGIDNLQLVKAIGALVVTYSFQDGITIHGTERYTYSSEQVDVETERKIPLIAGEGISIDAPDTADKVVIKSLSSNISNGTGAGSLIQKTVSSSETPYNNQASGSGAIALGKDVKSNGNTTFVIGQKNEAIVGTSASFTSGYLNVNRGSYNLTGGENNANNNSWNLVVGKNNAVSGGRFGIVSGLDNVYSGSDGPDNTSVSLLGNNLYVQVGYMPSNGALLIGQYNEIQNNSGRLFIVGNGTSKNRKNAFEVLNDGRVKVQSAPVDDNDVVRKLELNNGLSTKLNKPTLIQVESVLLVYPDGEQGAIPLSGLTTFKTLFGNQSITGTGNIDLYLHNIKFTKDHIRYAIQYPSSKNINVDSLTDLKTLITDNEPVPVMVIDYPGTIMGNAFLAAQNMSIIIWKQDGKYLESLSGFTITDTVTAI